MKVRPPKDAHRKNTRVIFLLAGIYFTLVMAILFMARVAASGPAGPIS